MRRFCYWLFIVLIVSGFIAGALSFPVLGEGLCSLAFFPAFILTIDEVTQEGPQ